MLFLFSHREAEVTQLSAESEVFTVGECHESALLEVQLSLAVEVLFVGVYAHYLRKEHGVGAQQL